MRNLISKIISICVTSIIVLSGFLMCRSEDMVYLYPICIALSILVIFNTSKRIKLYGTFLLILSLGLFAFHISKIHDFSQALSGYGLGK